jgi:hypothetical protein
MATATSKRITAIETAGEVLPGGVALELVRDPIAKALRLVSCDGKILGTGPQISIGGRVYKPIAIRPSYAAALRFPSCVAPAESTRKLFSDVRALIKRYLAQLERCITALVFAIFASWLAPLLPMAPIFSIFAPPGSAKDLALRLLGLLCRRPLRLAGLTRGELLRVPMPLQLTLLLDEPDLRPGMQSILLAGAHRGSFVPGIHDVHDIFGTKIVVSGKPIVGTTLESDALRVTLIPVSGEMARLDQNAEERIAVEFQSRFLAYFLRNFKNLQDPMFDIGSVAQPLQNLARALGSAVVGDETLQAEILPLIKAQDEELRTERASTFDSVVIEVGLFFIHEGGWSKVRADATAQKVDAILKGRGSAEEVSAERVGWAWKRLGIPSGRINRSGNGVELNPATSRLIHQLAFSFDVRAIQSGPRSDCLYCREIEPPRN